MDHLIDQQLRIAAALWVTDHPAAADALIAEYSSLDNGFLARAEHALDDVLTARRDAARSA